MTDPLPDALVDLEGQVERVTYTSDETGYTVAQIRVPGTGEGVTVVGNLPSPAPGEMLYLKGEWTRHPQYGRQFKVHHHESRIPVTIDGIRIYLGSGVIKGIGKVYAERIVRKFGPRTLDVIENHIERLSEVEGIGKKRLGKIRAAWDAHTEARDIMIFLQSHGIGTGYAAKIYKRYGKRAVSVVRKNPYRLAADITGIGFFTADRIAESLNISKTSNRRITAGILHLLEELANDGHVYFPLEPLLQKCGELINVDREKIARAVETLVRQRKLVREAMGGETGSEPKDSAIYLARFHRYETGIIEHLIRLGQGPRRLPKIETERAVADAQKKLNIRLAREQEAAVALSVENRFMVITGGPGTGKTTLISAILSIFSGRKVKTLLAAPTGRAAKRMTESTGREAMTLHRMLEFSPQRGGFQKNEENPLDCDLIVIDEASMIDIILMHGLLAALPRGASLVLVGDVHQLPSVGAGNVLKDIIDSGRVPVVKLEEIFRQARSSRIIVNAHRINRGDLPDLDHPKLDAPLTDFYFIEQDGPGQVLDTILKLVTDRIPGRFKLDPIDDIQVLTPMHKGVVGVENLNVELQQALNPGKFEMVRGNFRFRLKDKVMQIRNNYEKEVFNGDLGRVVRIDPELQNLTVKFEKREILYDAAAMDEIVPAYAISVHKSQGSEYPAVIIPMVTQHYILLQRNLIYTAVTRGEKLVVMVGSKKALAIGIRNDTPRKRFTRLRQRLCEQ